MIAPLVFSRPELLTEGVKEPITDSQGTLHRVMGRGVGWAWEGSQASATSPPSASSVLVLSSPGILPLPSSLGLPQLVATFVPESQELASCSPWLLSPPPPERDSGDPFVDESLKRQGFQGKVAVQDGVSCPIAMTLTWLGFGGVGLFTTSGSGGPSEMDWQLGQGCSLPALSERLRRSAGLWWVTGHRMQESPTVHLGRQLTCPLHMRQSAVLLLL